MAVTAKNSEANDSESPKFRKAVEQGRALSRHRKTYARAAAQFERALAETPEHPEALFYLAKLQYKRKDIPGCLSLLQRLAASKHKAMPRWRVEARFDIDFKPLRGNDVFRKAVGITHPSGEVPSLYERLVAFGGRWEQEGIPCEQAKVNLTLRRDKKQRFDLVIRSKCQGSAETTRLDGNWSPGPRETLSLRLPNVDVAEDLLSCQMEQCTDASGEDCLRCRPDQDTEFLLRVVRR